VLSQLLLGALLVKNSSEAVLVKTYFGGGTVEVALSSERFHSKRKQLNERFVNTKLCQFNL